MNLVLLLGIGIGIGIIGMPKFTSVNAIYQGGIPFDTNPIVDLKILCKFVESSVKI